MTSDCSGSRADGSRQNDRGLMLTAMQRGCDYDITAETFGRIAELLSARSGFSLTGYKDKCVKRRINIRVRATQSASPEQYCALLSGNTEEQDLLLRVLTIHVSQFFRNPSTFHKISSDILPGLLELREGGPLRMLSLGCAGGEEPYTLAILLSEHFPELVSAGRFSIHGVDVDPGTLEAARKAVYAADRLAEVAPNLLCRWFTPEGPRFRLNPEVRSLVHFSQADLNAPAPLQPCDLILCRNVLIYFERERQEAILNRFADALQGGGVLVLGKSESLFGTARSRFRTVCPVERIYRAA